MSNATREYNGCIPPRIRWGINSAGADFPGTENSVRFQWSVQYREWNKNDKRYVPLERPEYVLVMDGTSREGFRSLVEMKCFIIRWVYSIPEVYLIPSELLAEASLAYSNPNVWIDEWYCFDEQPITVALGEIQRPPTRKLRLASNWSHRSLPASYTPSKKPHLSGRVNAQSNQPELIAPKRRDRENLELSWEDSYNLEKAEARQSGLSDTFSDEECFFELPVGSCSDKCLQLEKKNTC